MTDQEYVKYLKAFPNKSREEMEVIQFQIREYINFLIEFAQKRYGKQKQTK